MPEQEGEQKVIHTHEIEVFGSPCDCGTRHEYCGECSWVEPCEQEEELTWEQVLHDILFAIHNNRRDIK